MDAIEPTRSRSTVLQSGAVHIWVLVLGWDACVADEHDQAVGMICA
jgi:hypothetical protein